jgi:hypothetical protein
VAGQNSDFMNMQRDAERRVLEMQRRAKQMISPQEKVEPAPTVADAVGKTLAPKRNFLEMLNLKTLFEGKDTSLVLMVLALLSSDETDPLLMLALLYIMM